MNCLSPLSLPRPDGTGNKDRITVPCGICVACIAKRREQWAFRLEQEYKYSETAYFITFTYSDEHLTWGKYPTLLKSDIQGFLKRLRQNVKRVGVMTSLGYKRSEIDPKRKIRYYIIGEYGTTTKRPHYHGLMFNLPVNPHKLLLLSWNMGFIHVGNVSNRSIRYCTTYMLVNRIEKEGKAQEFAVMSLKPGIGSKYIDVAKSFHQETLTNFTVTAGHKVALPRYYKDRMFNDLDKEELTRRSMAHNNYAEQIREKALANIKNRGDLEIAEKESYKKSQLKSIDKKQKL